MVRREGSDPVAEVEPNSKEADRLVANLTRFMSHPWAAVEDGYIWTIDQNDMSSPIKRFPKHPWLRECTEIWLREQLTAWPKSRRMLMSWLMIWNHLWLGMTGEGRAVYIQSETEEKSNELIQRAEGIYLRLPRSELVLPKLRNSRAFWCLLDFRGLHSFLKGVPQGQNQLRQYTATAVLMDEAAFWEKGRESFAATKPTVEGGGKVTVISSAQAGWFKDLVFDEVT